MKWHEWTTLRHLAETRFGKRAIRDLGDEFPDRLLVSMYTKKLAVAEDVWISLRRPYFSVWPVATQALLKVKLDIPTHCVKLPLPVMLLKFGVGCEPVEHGWRLQCMLVCAEDEPAPRVAPNVPGLRCVSVFSDAGGQEKVSSLVFILFPGTTVEQSLQAVRDSDASILAELKNSVTTEEFDRIKVESPPPYLDSLCTRLVCGLCLLADDPALITRDVLAADQAKAATASPEQLDQLVDKAVRRGKHGFSVGASWEMIPHYRRPHFGIRWYGPRDGHQTAKLVAISGAIVHRNKLSDVPTGYESGETSPNHNPHKEQQ